MNGVRALILAAVVVAVAGHGLLLVPLNRGSMWRDHPELLPNYEDNANFCGGYVVQHQENGGRCGLCGDNWADPTPRANEDGGKYGMGIIAETYESEAVVELTVLLTANHLGYYNYSICNMDHGTKESEECFDEWPVLMANGDDRWIVTKEQQNNQNMKIKLPLGLKCDHCVLRWNYHTGNSVGPCDEGGEALGCGPQENFRTCTDITIR